MVTNQMEDLKILKNRITRFILVYKFALSELETKIEILQEEFQLLHDYNPIEYTKSRIKSPESIIKKWQRKGGGMNFQSLKDNVRDIAGLRITCSFIMDIYRISDMLKGQSDLKIVEVKDYIKHPKPNGYQSYHMLLEVPVFMSDRIEQVLVEVQIRTMAMDFWASLEHKIFYKYDQAVPEDLLKKLKDAADSATLLDRQMEQLHHEINIIKHEHEKDNEDDFSWLIDKGQQISIPMTLLELMDGEFEGK